MEFHIQSKGNIHLSSFLPWNLQWDVLYCRILLWHFAPIIILLSQYCHFPLTHFISLPVQICICQCWADRSPFNPSVGSFQMDLHWPIPFSIQFGIQQRSKSLAPADLSLILNALKRIGKRNGVDLMSVLSPECECHHHGQCDVKDIRAFPGLPLLEKWVPFLSPLGFNFIQLTCHAWKSENVMQ